MPPRKRIYEPRLARVETGNGNRPRSLGGVVVTAIREEWVVEDRWWARVPICRHYFELALGDGRCETVFRERGRWYRQRA